MHAACQESLCHRVRPPAAPHIPLPNPPFCLAGGGGGADDVEPAIPAGHPPRLGQATSTASASTRVVAQGGGGGGARGRELGSRGGAEAGCGDGASEGTAGPARFLLLHCAAACVCVGLHERLKVCDTTRRKHCCKGAPRPAQQSPVLRPGSRLRLAWQCCTQPLLLPGRLLQRLHEVALHALGVDAAAAAATAAAAVRGAAGSCAAASAFAQQLAVSTVAQQRPLARRRLRVAQPPEFCPHNMQALHQATPLLLCDFLIQPVVQPRHLSCQLLLQLHGVVGQQLAAQTAQRASAASGAAAASVHSQLMAPTRSCSLANELALLLQTLVDLGYKRAPLRRQLKRAWPGIYDSRPLALLQAVDRQLAELLDG